MKERLRSLDRRSFLRSSTALGFGALLGSTRVLSAAEQKIVMGFVYSGPKNDLGYNEAHVQGALALKALPYVRVIDQEDVAETNDVEEAMRDMIHMDGAQVIFGTSYGYLDPYMLRLARECQQVQFFHCGGAYREGIDPTNLGVYFGFIDEVEYLAGMAAGLMTKSGLLGFVAAKPIPQVLRNINSYMLGARSVHPTVAMKVIFTGDWVLPVREAEAASSLADQGADVLTGHTGSPRVIVQIAEQRGIWATGYQFDQSSVAPHRFLTGAEWSWGVVYLRYAKMMHAGKSVTAGTIPRRVTGTLKDGFCRLSKFGPGLPSVARARIIHAQQEMIEGTRAVYQGPLRDNKGRIVVLAGTTISVLDPQLDHMNWLLEGIDGEVGS